MLSDTTVSSPDSDADGRVAAGGLLALRLIVRDAVGALESGEVSSPSISPASSPPERLNAVMAARVPLPLPRPPLALPLVILLESETFGFDCSWVSSVWMAEGRD